MGFTSAVDWWEESQMRVLVLGSLILQSILFTFSFVRRLDVPRWCRSLMWLAYLGRDAMAIYALATLFNRHKGHYHGVSRSSTLEVVWAPVLLLHLGGIDGITAYNIEDNELWGRYMVTAVSQVTVAVYVFWKSWPGDDERLFQAAILLFVPGIIKCFVKPLVLKRASFNSLVSSAAAANQTVGGMYPLNEYVKQANAFVILREQNNDDASEAPAHGGARTPSSSMDMENGDHHHPAASQAGSRDASLSHEERMVEEVRKRAHLLEERREASNLCADLSFQYPRRLRVLQHFWVLSEDEAYTSVRRGLSSAFFVLYTKLKTSLFWQVLGEDYRGLNRDQPGCLISVEMLIQMARMSLPWASVGLFHCSHREAYNDIDVKITYAVFCVTAVLELLSYVALAFAIEYVERNDSGSSHDPMRSSEDEYWPEMVSQHSLIGYFARNKNHSKWVWIVSMFGCKDFLDQKWLMKPCFSSRTITKLVLQYLKIGWTQEIHDVAGYRRFNDHSSHWVRMRTVEGPSSGGGGLRTFTIKRPFDESVLLWHIATDLCFFLSSSTVSDHIRVCAFAKKPSKLELEPEPEPEPERVPLAQGSRRPNCGEETTNCKAVLCTQMSNYMVYLLFVNPEMLLPGSRRNLFTKAHKELEGMFTGTTTEPPLEKGALTEKIWRKLDASEGSNLNLIREAWRIAQELHGDDENNMWQVIQDVWVEMLCFSASRCRGYLHAKAFADGGEFLSYVWLLLSRMGMETFTERLQRQEQLPSQEEVGNDDDGTV